MDITSITSARAENFLDPAIANRPTGGKSLDVDDFLKLITVQLTSQDPMKPMEDTQFISQMASFTSLEQMRTLSDNFATFNAGQQISSAQNFIGKLVTVATDAGEITGTVNSVSVEDGNPLLVINGGVFSTADVIGISMPPAPAATTPTP
jgi:flagellar basal-body rod modification protein FlgD